MKNLKHTPGPWVADDTRCRTAINAYEKHICMVNYYVASDPKSISLEEHEANARLIAAAPEMLEALVAAYKLLRIHGVGRYSALSEVIEKATGMKIEEVLS